MSISKEAVSLAEVMDDLDARNIQGVYRYRAVNGYISLKARYKDIPVSGTFELTPLCNLDCKMCYVHLNSNQIQLNERLCTVEEWKSIIDQAIEAGMLFADLTGGECLTYPGFREVYLHLFSRGIHPGILTNGRLLTEEMIAFLAEYPPAVLQITLYGSNDDAYEKVCGHRAFSEVMGGINRAKKAGLPVYVSVTPNRFMQEDISSLLDLVHSLGVPYTIGGVTIPARPETGRNIEQFAIELDAAVRINREENQYLSSISGDSVSQPVPQYLPSHDHPLQGLPCGGGHSSFHVNWRGELCPCIAFSATVHYEILKCGFWAAWNAIRQEMLTYKPPDQCSDCHLKRYCITCPGEKSNCVVGGSVNPLVCMKLQRHVDEGLIQIDGVI